MKTLGANKQHENGLCYPTNIRHQTKKQVLKISNSSDAPLTNMNYP